MIDDAPIVEPRPSPYKIYLNLVRPVREALNVAAAQHLRDPRLQAAQYIAEGLERDGYLTRRREFGSPPGELER